MSIYLGVLPALSALALGALTAPPRDYTPALIGSLSELSDVTPIRLNASHPVERARFSPLDGVLRLPAGSITAEQATALLDSNHVEFLIRGALDEAVVGLSTLNVRAYRFEGNRLVIGARREPDAALALYDAEACEAELFEIEDQKLRAQWEAFCQNAPSDQIELDPDSWPKRDRPWGELLKRARGDQDALGFEEIERRGEHLGASYRRHVALWRAVWMAQKRGDFAGALKPLERAEMLGRRYDVERAAGTARLIQDLGEAILRRALIEELLAQRPERVAALYHDYSPWFTDQPAWLKRLTARALRRAGHPDQSAALYLEVLDHEPAKLAVLGEWATLILSRGEVYRARAAQRWAEERLELEEREEFTALIERVEEARRCDAFSLRCEPGSIEMPSEDAFSQALRPSWGELESAALKP